MNTPRFTPGANQDNTLRTVTQDYQSPPYAASITINTVYEKTKVKVGLLTGALSLTIGQGSSTNPPNVGDICEFIFTADGTNRTVTFAGGFAGLSSLTVNASTEAYASFIFTGVDWAYMVSSGLTTVPADIQTPAYASTLSITTTKRNTIVIPGQLTGALTVNGVVTSALAGDKMTFLFANDATQRVVTFGTNFTSDSTLILPPSTNATVSFIYNGTSWIQDGQLRTLVDDVQSPAYAATLTIAITKRKTKVIPAQLTGAVTINMTLTNAVKGDEVIFGFSADSSNRIVTYGTGIQSAGTHQITASKFGGSSFIYDGTELIETGRAITV